METREIWHEILIKGSPEKLYRALTDVDQLAHWWTTGARGESIVGGYLEFWFGGFRGCVMKVVELKPGELVHWHAADKGLPDWIGTRVEFRIFVEKDQAVLHFRRSQWRDDAKLFPHCSLGWAIYLMSLKEFVETGKGRPYPYDLPINLSARLRQRHNDRVRTLFRKPFELHSELSIDLITSLCYPCSWFGRRSRFARPLRRAFSFLANSPPPSRLRVSPA